MVFGFCAAYTVSTLVFIIPKSRSFFERTLPWLCLSAVLVGVVGYIQRGLGLEVSFFTKGTGQTDFFAFFPYGGHWAAFASLWCSSCIAMALLSTRYDDSPIFIHSVAPWYLTGGTLLGATGILVESPIPAAILLFTLAAMLLIFSVDFLVNSTDIHKTPIAISSGVSSCFCFAAGIYRILQEDELHTHASTLRSAAYDMFRANPIFGWGADAYGKVLPFFSNDNFAGAQAERATSDIMQLAAEFGLIGLLTVICFFLYFMIRYLLGRHDIQLTNHLLVGCFAVLILSALDSPFMSPAVFFSFFVIFFSAMRWADLSRNKVDEVDAQKPQLVTPQSHRRVPFFTKHYREKEK
jgi:O-antigen ligase